MIPFLEIFICILVWLTFGPFWIMFTLLNEAYRLFVKSLLWGTRITLGTDGLVNFIVSPIVSTPICVILLFSKGEEDLHLDTEVNDFNTRVFEKKSKNGTGVYDLFKKTFTMTFGYCSVRDESELFDIKNHVKFYKDSEILITEDDLHKNIVPTLLKDTFDGTSPQWEFLLFPRIQREDGTIQSVRVLRWHHAYMDGAAAGMLMAESLFDQSSFPEGKVPYIVNPKVPVAPYAQRLVAKVWGWFHLPVIVLLELIAALTRKNKAKGPFTVNSYEGAIFRSKCESVSTSILRRRRKRQNPTSKCSNGVVSILTTALGRPIAQIWRDMHNNLKIDRGTVISVEAPIALLPYPDSKPRNQFSLMEFKVTIDGSKKWVEPEMNWTIYFARIYSLWLGRLPLTISNIFMGTGESPVQFNYMPFLRKKGSIRGHEITQIAAYAMLLNPIGIDITAIGYAEEITFTCSAAEECMSNESLERFMGYYVNEIMDLCNEGDDVV